MYTEFIFPDKRIVFTDDRRAFEEEKKKGTCLITTRSDLDGADSYIEDEEQINELTDDYFLRLYDRHVGRPHVILEFPYAENDVVLRELSAKDYESYLLICSQGGDGIYGSENSEKLKEELIKYRTGNEEYREQKEREFGKNVSEHYRLFDFGLWITLIDNKPAAIAGLESMEDGIYLGYVVDRAYRNKGLATFICRRICRYAEDELGITQIKARVDKDNIPSLRVIEKLGIKNENV